ncbi:MAG: CHAT domain-containing protein [Blastocatellia bacterium]|nr:CHAT domain-containing protein [Blastocatellia bacterium]
MIALLFFLPVGLSAISVRPTGTVTFPKTELQTQEVRILASGVPVEREISGAGRQLYQIVLEAGQCLKIVAEQRGADISLALIDPDGKQMASAENKRGGVGVEWLLWQAQTPGNYLLEIDARENSGGGYRLKAEIFAPQGDVLPAFQSYLEARRLSIQKKPELGDRSLRLQEESLAAWKRLNDPQMEGLMTLTVARSAIRTDSKKSLAYYQRAIPIFRTLGMKAEEAHALEATGLMFIDLGGYRDSIPYLEQALALAEYFRPDVVRMIPGALSSSYYAIGESQKALEWRLKSLADARAANDKSNVCFELEMLSEQYLTMGEPAKSLECVNEALQLNRETKSSSPAAALPALMDNEASLLGVLGNLHRIAGDNEKAIEILRQSMDMHREAGAFDYAAARATDLGDVYLGQGRRELALDLYNQALAQFQKGSSIDGEARALTMIGKAHLQIGNYQQALDALTRALAVIRADGIRYEEWEATLSLADVYEQTGDAEKAAALLDETLSLSRKMGVPEGEAASLTRLARLARKKGDFKQARQFFEASLHVSEERRFRLGPRPLEDSFRASLQSDYEEFTELLMQSHVSNPLAGYDSLAFENSERARARGLLDLLAESRAEINRGVDPLLLEKCRALRQRLNDKDLAWRQSLNKPIAAAETEALAKEIDSLTSDLQLAELRIREASPRYAALVRPQPLSAAEVEQSLDDSAILLEFALGDKRSWLWAVTRNSISSHQLPPRAEIEVAARKVYELLTARQPKKDLTEEEGLKRIDEADTKFPTESATLSRMLLGPISAQLRQEWKGKRLVIVASGALQYVPFAVLPLPDEERQGDQEASGQGDKETRRQDSYPLATNHHSIPNILIASHEIVYIPSASALAELRREIAVRESAEKTLAVIADPVFEQDDPRVLASIKKRPSTSRAANVRPAASLTPISPLARSLRSFNREGFSRLPFSREEADDIAEFIPRSALFKAVDFQANRTLAMSGELGHYRIIHFATHGLLNSEHPELSGLVLSLVDKAGKPQDGFLRMDEIFNLRLPADLVVLSACQTALGKEIKGEGLIGLTRGFMYAGAERVVASLWQVDDEATAELMKRFYRGMLKEGLRPAAALHEAQIEMSKSSRWSPPYYWAGFVLQGEWK